MHARKSCMWHSNWLKQLCRALKLNRPFRRQLNNSCANLTGHRYTDESVEWTALKKDRKAHLHFSHKYTLRFYKFGVRDTEQKITNRPVCAIELGLTIVLANTRLRISALPAQELTHAKHVEFCRKWLEFQLRKTTSRLPRFLYGGTRSYITRDTLCMPDS